jgi:hypothetical protein
VSELVALTMASRLGSRRDKGDRVPSRTVNSCATILYESGTALGHACPIAVRALACVVLLLLCVGCQELRNCC